MSSLYMEQKIKEALEKSDGNQNRAKQYILEWATQDMALLLGLTKAHLNGLAAYAVTKVARTGHVAETPVQNNEHISTAAKGLNRTPESFGKDLLLALSGRDTVHFGMESASGRPVSRRSKASQSHIDAIKSLAAGRVASKPKKS